MKMQNGTASQSNTISDRKRENAEVAEFHTRRLAREKKIRAKEESPGRPEGTYDCEQMIAEDADFNTKPMIEKAAFFLAEQRGFAPGKELSDWVQAEADVESLMRNNTIDRCNANAENVREAGSLKQAPMVRKGGHE